MSARVLIGVDEWHAPNAQLLEFDRRVHEAEDRWGAVAVSAAHGSLTPEQTALAAEQIARRYQRCRPVRNAASRARVFDEALTRHRRLHDLSAPLVRADHDHAIDVWQWVLVLDPMAGLALQLAALFHDVERLESEAKRRVEQHAADYQAFKDLHARRGAELMRETLSGLGVPHLDEASALVEQHERPAATGALAVLSDADALSFFSLNSWGFVAHYGPEHTRKKVLYTLSRMSPGARRRVRSLRLPPAFEEWLQRA